MGYTSFTVELLEKVIKKYNPKSVIDAGAQNLFNQPVLPAPYTSTFYEEKGIAYRCIDLNGENWADQWDLGTVLSDLPLTDLFICAGTKEHVGKDGAFSWEAIYNCFQNYHRMTKIGGIQVHENPKTGSWPLHGFSYFTESFYKELAALTDYEILELGEHPAMGNTHNGWNIYCVLRKHSERFPTLQEFTGFSLYQK